MNVFAGSIRLFEIAKLDFQSYIEIVRMGSIGIKISIFLLLGKYVLFRKIHQKMNVFKEEIT